MYGRTAVVFIGLLASLSPGPSDFRRKPSKPVTVSSPRISPMTFTVQTTRLLLICIVGALLVAPLLHVGVMREHFSVADSIQLMAMMYVPSLVLGSIVGYCLLAIVRWVAGAKRLIAANILLAFRVGCLLFTISNWWIGHLNFGVNLLFDSPPAAAAFNGLASAVTLVDAVPSDDGEERFLRACRVLVRHFEDGELPERTMFACG